MWRYHLAPNEKRLTNRDGILDSQKLSDEINLNDRTKVESRKRRYNLDRRHVVANSNPCQLFLRRANFRDRKTR
jgi:hypothetical protein